ncbi:Uncharacterised protein [Mycobacteroides abscessus subsp. abscessus]|nr:Uncharacterised protein [Mycobacteroides abscessus subsp. abscessus]
MAPPDYRPILGAGGGVSPLGLPEPLCHCAVRCILSDMSTTAVRFTLTTLSTLTVALGVYVLPTTHPVSHALPPLPVCEQEDGNTDGAPCNWTDPDTGAVYYVDSSNYR